MGITDFCRDERLQWLRYVLRPSGKMPAVGDWQRLLEFSKRQAIVGVCDPTRFDAARPDAEVLFEWIGLVEQLKELNDHLNKQTAELVDNLRSAGFRCCILKGQGNATMYPDAGLRTPGDIDVWVEAKKEDLQKFTKDLFPDAKESFKHIKYPMFSDTAVDLHYTPLKMYHPVYNKRLQKWIQDKKDEQMTHLVRLTGTETDIAIPTAIFNAVYQLGHILIHIEDKGIGLRQMIDFFYVLKQLGSLSETEKIKIVDTWRRLGMRKLAGAVMWVEHKLLGLTEEYLLVSCNEKTGRLLAEDILKGGNFGRYRRRHSCWRFGRYARKSFDVWHLVRLSACFPGEALFRLVSKIRTAGRMLIRS